MTLLDIFTLESGSHGDPRDGVCVMEAVAWLAGEPHSDHPICACPVISRYCMALNDRMPDEQRQRLIAFLPRLIGSHSPDHCQRRYEYLARQAVTVFVPLALDAARLPKLAAKLRALPSDASMNVLGDAAIKVEENIAAYVAAAEAVGYVSEPSIIDAIAYSAYVSCIRAVDYAAYPDDETDVSIAAAAATSFAVAVAVAAKKAASLAGSTVVYEAAQVAVWDAALAALDNVLSIGPEGDAALSPQVEARAEAYGKLMATRAEE